MKKTFTIIVLILLMVGFHLSAQDTLSNGKGLNFPTKKYGIRMVCHVFFLLPLAY